MKQLQLIILLATSALLAACASVPMASFDKDAQAKAFNHQKLKAQLYIYRDESFGAMSKMSLELDGIAIGETAAHTYAVVSLKPGSHTLTSKSSDDSRLVFSVKAGQNYYIQQEVKLGWLGGRSKLQLVDEVTGKAAVEKSKLIQLSGLPADMAMPSESEQSAANQEEVERIAFRAGVSSATVEKLAKQNSCVGEHGAGLLTPPGPVEVYRVSCDQGAPFMARCELRQCKAMR
ncbi:DUF2846 domain-containing protein [Undibacterium terreum]|nr:DUF2846 domain-containing protein [Undibacterium terreum]